MKRHTAILIAVSCAILAVGCSKRAPAPPSPPPAALPSVEAVDVKPQPAPKVVSAPVQEIPQPTRNLYFEFDVDTLVRGQVKLLEHLARWAQKYGKTIHVTGYADTVGTDEYNMALSLRRAENVAARLTGASVEAKGETSRFGEDGRNRRVTLEAR